jgi:phage shock protein C
MITTDRRLRRSTTESVIGGVCAGVARYLAKDPTLIRLAWVLVAFFGGAGILAYLIAWLVIPDDDGQHTLAPLLILIAIIGLPLILALSFLLPVSVSMNPN